MHAKLAGPMFQNTEVSQFRVWGFGDLGFRDLGFRDLGFRDLGFRF